MSWRGGCHSRRTRHRRKVLLACTGVLAARSSRGLVAGPDRRDLATKPFVSALLGHPRASTSDHGRRIQNGRTVRGGDRCQRATSADRADLDVGQGAVHLVDIRGACSAHQAHLA